MGAAMGAHNVLHHKQQLLMIFATDYVSSIKNNRSVLKKQAVIRKSSG
jgi:hypothetical protein